MIEYKLIFVEKRMGMNTLSRLLGLVLCLCLAAGSASAFTSEREQMLRDSSLALLEYIQSGEEEEALALMDDAMRGAMAGQISAMWAQLAALGGEFVGVGLYQSLEEGGYEIILLELRFARLSLIQRAVFDEQGKIAGLFFTPGSIEPEAAEAEETGFEEIPLTVDAGEGYPLKALLTLPEGEIRAGLVLVQGSGPSDMDESIGANAPLRDLARGLAARGIASLRYDKRSFTWGAQMAQEEGFARITVEEETVNDAAQALLLMRKRPEMEGKPLYLLGHSLGAMLASYIGAQKEAPDGYILLAGSPRKLWEISAEQNLAIALEFDAAGDMDKASMTRGIVAAEREKAARMDELADDDTIFGLPVPYLRHLDAIDAAALHLEDKKPVLVLQGERDRQVTMADYALWKEKLADHPAAEFISYPALNHLFGDYQGDPVPFSQLLAEYAARTPVDERVIGDIAEFMLRSPQR